MDIKIDIVGIFPQDDSATTDIQRNSFEEIALFLDCPSIQQIIKKFRARINYEEAIKYDEFEHWKNTITEDILTKEEKNYLYNLDVEIDHLQNRYFNELTLQEAQLLESKQKEKLQWLDPFFTFSRALEHELKGFDKVSYFDVLIKAIVCGEIRREDIKNVHITRKNSRDATFSEREAYWLRKIKKIGYGTVGKQQGFLLRTIASKIKSYKQKLSDYETQLSPSLL